MQRSLLGIFPKLTGDLSKSAHMLLLKYLVPLGWKPTVVMVTGTQENNSEEMWQGIRVVRYRPRSKRWRVTQTLSKFREADHSGPLHTALSKSLLPLSGALSYPDS